MLTIGFISAFNPADRNEFSGTIYYMYQALSSIPSVKVEVLGKTYLQPGHPNHFLWRLLRHRRLAVFSDLERYSDYLLKHRIEADLDRLDNQLDAIIAPVASGIICALNLTNHNMPVILITDSTPSYIHENYEKIALLEETVMRENQTLHKSAKVVYSSRFMADRALQEYEALAKHPEKIEVLPFGLNLDVIPTPEKAKTLEGPIKLLFVGKCWERKGGQIAVDTLNALLDKGVTAHLTILGCKPVDIQSEHIDIIPFLDKNTPSEQQRYIDLLKASHFLLLPTRADCTPMVIAEANAFGIPVLATDVGGISSLIENLENGILFDFHDTGAQYASQILDTFNNKAHYKAMSIASRSTYEKRLNWVAWANGIKDIVVGTEI